MRREAAVSPDVFVFAGFRLEGASGELFRLEGTGNAVPVALGARATALLRLLVEQHGKLVSKDTIMDVVWRGRIVGEANLTT
ncbi:MAG: winged helix-turn-helix domain-containing protein, partial [Alphaproteobacteria bacterium]|nr:winged helix-turn-helix domain-containing protein [Alphaproteobacteria bacterium]